jgi:hypothetical protein
VSYILPGPYMLLGYTSYTLSPAIWYFLCICDYFYITIVGYKLIPAAVLSKIRVCGRWLLGSRVRIPLTARTFYFLFAVSSVGSVLCDVLITRAEESYRVCVCVWTWNLNNEAALTRVELLRQRRRRRRRRRPARYIFIHITNTLIMYTLNHFWYRD